MKNIFLGAIILLLLMSADLKSFCQNGNLDGSFGNNGIFRLDTFTLNGQGSEGVYQLKEDAYGRIVALIQSAYYYGGGGNKAVVRLDNGGAFDTTFNSTGYNILPYFAPVRIAFQEDKLVICGVQCFSNNHNVEFVRLNANGIIDSSFNNFDTVLTHSLSLFGNAGFAMGRDIVQLPGGKLQIPFWGEGNFYGVIQVDSLGHPDLNYSVDGLKSKVLSFWAFDLIRDANGRFDLLGWAGSNGQETNMVRFQTDVVNIDNSFGSSGLFSTVLSQDLTDDPRSLEVDNLNKIIIGASADNSLGNNEAVIIRLNSDGNFDTSFNSTGIVRKQIGNSYNEVIKTIQLANGNMLVCGHQTSIASKGLFIMELKADGSLNTGFGSNGLMTYSFSNYDFTPLDFAVQNDGKIILGGYLDSSLVQIPAILRITNDETASEISYISSDHLVTIYPNPASTQLFINACAIKVTEINIYNNIGKMVRQIKNPLPEILDVSDLINGVYILEMKTSDGSIVKKWVKV